MRPPTFFMTSLASFCATVLYAAPSPITYRFEGTVKTIYTDEGPPLPGVAPGSAFSGIYTFDPLAVDSAMAEYQGVYRYEAPNAVQVVIDGFSWHADKSAISITDGTGPNSDSYGAGASRMVLDTPSPIQDLFDIWIFQLQLQGGDPLTDTELPLEAPDPSQWNSAQLRLIGEDSRRSGLDPMPALMVVASLTRIATVLQYGDLDGDDDSDGNDLLIWQRNVGSAASAIPEPSALALIVIAAVGMAARRLRRA